MTFVRNRALGIAAAALGALLMSLAVAGTSDAAPRVVTLNGFKAPGTPAQYNKVKVVKQGSPQGKKILVLVPGTSAGATNFGPLASALVKQLKGWQVWSIERRENLLEDHSALQKYLKGTATGQELYDYYLGSIINPAINPKFTPKTDEETSFAKDWGMNVAVNDVRKVVNLANRGGREVVLGGHSLGGSITTAYATWDFNGKAGAKSLDGLVFIDGAGASGASRPLPTAAQAQENLDSLNDPGESPFLTLVPPFPWAAGVFNAIGSTLALKEPNAPATLGASPIIPSYLKPPVPATNAGSYGYAVDNDTGPESLVLVQSHIGELAAAGDPRGWQNGELGTVSRAASVFSEHAGGMDGTSWYHPTRLSIDAGAINNGINNPAQAVYGDKATKGKSVKLPMYSFDTVLGGGRVADATRALARQSKVPYKWIRTVKRVGTYSHIDPLSASPAKNDFIKTLVPFLKTRIK